MIPTIAIICFNEYQGPEPDMQKIHEINATNKLLIKFHRYSEINNDPSDEYWSVLLPNIYRRNIKLLYPPSEISINQAMDQWKTLYSSSSDFSLIFSDQGKLVFQFNGLIIHDDPIEKLKSLNPFNSEASWCHCCYRPIVVQNINTGNWFCNYCNSTSKTWKHSKRYCFLRN